MRAHHQVRVPVPAGVRAVRADAADLRGEMDDELGLRVREEALDVAGARQVVVAAAGDERLEAVVAHALDEVRAEETRRPR